MKLLLLACRGRLLVLHKDVCLVTAHARLAFHKWIRLQLCHLIGVTGLACAERRRAREVRCRGLAMAHGAFDTVGSMRAGFPLVIQPLVAGGTGIPGWNQPMEYMPGLLLLSHGRLDGHRQNEKAEESQTEHARTQTIQGQASRVPSSSIQPPSPAISDMDHVSPECDRLTGCQALLPVQNDAGFQPPGFCFARSGTLFRVQKSEPL